uniref:ARAD1B17380p n=1 Tax=Blastobotrys adeninivorans TaxID=409370 RepID=A0A060TCL6_BLAAD
MGFVYEHSGIPAAIFLSLYTVYEVIAIMAIRTHGFKSRYTILGIFALLRIGAQLCAVVFASKGYSAINWLIAYLVLGAEGYFSLVLGSFLFLAKGETMELGTCSVRYSKEELEIKSGGDPVRKRFYKLTSPAGLFHHSLIPANAIIIAGGSMLSGATPDESDYDSKVKTSKGLRGAGQAIFLVNTALVGLYAVYLLTRKFVRIPIVYLVLAAVPFLLVRGVYGLLSPFVSIFNYFDMSNYTSHGVSTGFVVCEYILGAAMEFIAASILISSYFFRNKGKQTEYIHHRGKDQEQDEDNNRDVSV